MFIKAFKINKKLILHIVFGFFINAFIKSIKNQVYHIAQMLTNLNKLVRIKFIKYNISFF